MDNLTTLLRRYHRTHYEADHAKLIAEALRQDRLAYDDVAIMAVLGHHACQFVLAYNHHNTCFVYHDRLLKTTEPQDIINELHRFGSRATIMAACGVLSLIRPKMTTRPDMLDIIKHNVASYDRTVKCVLVQKIRPFGPWATDAFSAGARELRRDILARMRYPGIHSLVILNGRLRDRPSITSDDLMMTGMRNGIINFALGEFA